MDGFLKIKTFRPFPSEEILNIIKKVKYVDVIEKAISLGHIGPLSSEIKAITHGNTKAKINSYILGLGGRDITAKMIKTIINKKSSADELIFIGK